MHCTVEGNGVKVLARALQSLVRLGKDYIYVEPDKACFRIRTINSSHSAFGVFTFAKSFFVKYWMETEADSEFDIKLLHCRLSVKSVQGMVRSLNIPKHVESCTFTIRPEEDRVKVKLHCRYKVVKEQYLPVIAWETMELQIGQTPDMSNHFTASAKQFTDVLVNFYPNPNDITIIVTAQNLLLQNYIDGARDPKKERRTEMFLHAGEFHDYRVDNKSQVTFNVKDWKAVLSFAGAFTLPVSVNFQKAGRPVVFRVERESLFEAKFVLSTVLPLSDVPASENNIPDSALTVSKKLAEKHKNVELFKALERKQLATLNKDSGSKINSISTRAHSESRQGKKVVSDPVTFHANDVSSLELLSEWLPDEDDRTEAQILNRKRSLSDIEQKNNGKRLLADVRKCETSKRPVGRGQENCSVNDLDDNLNRRDQFCFVPMDSETQCDAVNSKSARDENPGKKLRACSSPEKEVCRESYGNPQLLSSQSVSEKIHTVFKCCFREPLDITELPGYDNVLAEDSDEESCR